MSISLCISFSGKSCSRSVKGSMDLIIGGRDLVQGVSSASLSGGVGGGGTVGAALRHPAQGQIRSRLLDSKRPGSQTWCWPISNMDDNQR